MEPTHFRFRSQVTKGRIQTAAAFFWNLSRISYFSANDDFCFFGLKHSFVLFQIADFLQLATINYQRSTDFLSPDPREMLIQRMSYPYCQLTMLFVFKTLLPSFPNKHVFDGGGPGGRGGGLILTTSNQKIIKNMWCNPGIGCLMILDWLNTDYLECPKVD